MNAPPNTGRIQILVKHGCGLAQPWPSRMGGTQAFRTCARAQMLRLFHWGQTRSGRAGCSLVQWVLFLPAFLAFALATRAADWHPAQSPLMTRWAAEVSPTNALPEYPRPQLVRADWLNLNGLWDYAITPDSLPKQPAFTGQILVPFPVEAALSGVMTNFNEHSKLCKIKNQKN